MYAEDARLVSADPALVIWASVAFVAIPHYIPPRNGDEIRWAVVVGPDGTLQQAGETDLFVTLPHEQVHSIQTSLGLHRLPRWFEEGQAEWASAQVTADLNPALGATKLENIRRQNAGGVPARLASWGGVMVAQDAMLRQLSPEQRKRMQTDSSYHPPGPFTFGPGDFVSDESNTSRRYAAAFDVFRTIAMRGGRERLESAFSAVWKHQTATSDELVKLLSDSTGVDVRPLVR